MPPWGVTQGAGPGEGMWMRWEAQGWAEPQARCLQWFGAPWWGLHVVSRTHVPWRILALDAVLLASPHPPSHAGEPSVPDKGREKCAGRWGCHPCSHALIFPTGKILCWGVCHLRALAACCRVSARLLDPHKDPLIHKWWSKSVFISGETMRLLPSF